MAIQNRRGAYVDFDKSKMVAGEIAVVQSGDPEADDGRGVYVSFQNGTAKRLAAHDELESYIDQQLSTIKDAIMADIRVISQTSDSELQAGDYVMVDSNSEGTRKFDLGTALTDIKEDLEEISSGGSGLTAAMKQALLQIASKVAYIDEHGQDYYDDLYDALYAITAIRLNTNSIQLASIGATSQLTATTVPEGGTVAWSSSDTSVATVSSTGLVTSVAYGSATITASSGSVSATCSVLVAAATCTGITAAYTQSGTVYDSDTLDSLKSDLVVTASWSNGTTTTLTDSDYTLSGTLATGTSTVTVSYAGQTTTFNVTVAGLSSITATYTQSGTVYDTASLDDLKTDLVVTANYSDSSTTTVASADYTLSGTLTEGTSTITVAYSGKTTTFNVTVTHYVEETVALTWTGSGTDKTTNLIDATTKTAYFTLPFVAGSSNLSSGATAETLGVKEYVEIYSAESGGTTRIGYYYTDTQQIESGRTVVNGPWVPFDTEDIFIPQGYYGKIVLSRVTTNAFPDNSNFLQYLNANATEAVMR